jgi:hypothetical protein
MKSLSDSRDGAEFLPPEHEAVPLPRGDRELVAWAASALEYEASRRREPGHVTLPRWAMRRWGVVQRTRWLAFSGRERFLLIRALRDYEDHAEEARDARLARLRALRWDAGRP